ncbi:hypothetical protein P5673_024550, partial [Acropora cervicornis]
IWTSRIKRNPNKDFRITSSTKVCSTHFEDEDFKSSESCTRRLKEGACPSVFSWSKPKTERSEVFPQDVNACVEIKIKRRSSFPALQELEITQFKEFLEFVLPNLNRSKLVYWGTACAKAELIDPSLLFGTPQNKPGTQSEDDDYDDKNMAREFIN